MILVDTSVWIEFFKAKDPVFTDLKKRLESGDIIAHSLIFAELLQGCRNKKEADLVLNYWDVLSDSESERGIIEGGYLSYEKKFYSRGVGLTDAVLVHECRRRSARIWTLDKKLLSLLKEQEIYLP